MASATILLHGKPAAPTEENEGRGLQPLTSNLKTGAVLPAAKATESMRSYRVFHLGAAGPEPGAGRDAGDRLRVRLPLGEHLCCRGCRCPNSIAMAGTADRRGAARSPAGAGPWWTRAGAGATAGLAASASIPEMRELAACWQRARRGGGGLLAPATGSLVEKAIAMTGFPCRRSDRHGAGHGRQPLRARAEAGKPAIPTSGAGKVANIRFAGSTDEPALVAGDSEQRLRDAGLVPLATRLRLVVERRAPRTDHPPRPPGPARAKRAGWSQEVDLSRRATFRCSQRPGANRQPPLFL